MIDQNNAKNIDVSNVQTNVFLCSCSDPEHQFIFRTYDNHERHLYLSVSLADNLSFFKRLVLAIKYVFGYRSRYGMFAETILNEESIAFLKIKLEQYTSKGDFNVPN